MLGRGQCVGHGFKPLTNRIERIRADLDAKKTTPMRAKPRIKRLLEKVVDAETKFKLGTETMAMIRCQLRHCAASLIEFHLAVQEMIVAMCASLSNRAAARCAHWDFAEVAKTVDRIVWLLKRKNPSAANIHEYIRLRNWPELALNHFS